MSLPDGSRGNLRRSVALVWRTLRSMRTAIVLLLMLAAAAVVGSLLPQIPVSPLRVAAYQVDHPFFGSFFNAIGAFDVFGSWWFALITALLFVSLVACLHPPVASDAARRSSAADARARARRVPELRGAPRRGRTRRRRDAARPLPCAVSVSASSSIRGRGAVAAEKGVAPRARQPRVPLGVPAAVDRRDHRQGHRLRRARDDRRGRDVDRRPAELQRRSADGPLLPGRLLRDVASRSSTTRTRSARRGSRWTSRHRCTSTAPDGETADETVRINHPVVFNGIRIYQFGFGWAAISASRRARECCSTGRWCSANRRPPGGNPLAQPWAGVVKLTTLRPQVAIVLQLFPSLEAYVHSLETGVPQPMTDASNPFMSYQVWQGRFVDSSVTGRGHALHASHRRRRDRPGMDGEPRPRLRRRRSVRPSARRARGHLVPGRRRSRRADDGVPGRHAVLHVRRSRGTRRSAGCWRRLSSSSWACCPRSTSRGARCGSGPVRRPTGGRSAGGRVRVAAQRSLRRGVRRAGRRVVRAAGGAVDETRGEVSARVSTEALCPSVVRRVQRGAVRLPRGDGAVVRVPGVPPRRAAHRGDRGRHRAGSWRTACRSSRAASRPAARPGATCTSTRRC